jgi:flagellar protein FliO/FliZ
MIDYILRLLILIPLVGGLAWGSLWLWRRAQGGLPLGRQQERALRIVDAVPISTGSKLAIVRFDDRNLLVAVTRGQITLLTEARPELIDG